MADVVTEAQGEGPRVLELANYLAIKVQGRTLDSHFTALYNLRMTRNHLSWRLI